MDDSMEDANHSFPRELLTSTQQLYLTNKFSTLIGSGRWDSRLYAVNIDGLSQHSQAQYKARIRRRIDLKLIKDRLRKGEYEYVKQYISDLDLLVSNTASFYGPQWAITEQAREIRRKVIEGLGDMPAKETDGFSLTPVKRSSAVSQLTPPSSGKKNSVTLKGWLTTPTAAGRPIATGEKEVPKTVRTRARFQHSNIPIDSDTDEEVIAPHFPSADVFLPQELEEAKRLTATLADAVNRFTDVHPELAHAVGRIGTQLGERLEHVEEEIEILRNNVGMSFAQVQNLRERLERLELNVNGYAEKPDVVDNTDYMEDMVEDLDESWDIDF